MKLRILLTVVALAFALHVRADDKKVEKIDTDKLVGMWERKEKQDGSVVLEFKTDGKALLTFTRDDKVFLFEGAYKIIGNKLEMTMRLGDRDEKSTRTITKLTDAELVTTDEKGMDRSFVRMKAN